jgi:hypothetical protein
MPEAAPLALLRTDIDRNPHRMKRVLMEPEIRKEVLGCISKDEKQAVKAFISQNGENALKTKPKVSYRCPALVSSCTNFLPTTFALARPVECSAIVMN